MHHKQKFIYKCTWRRDPLVVVAVKAVLEAVEQLWQESEGDDNGLIAGHVVEATLDELHPDEPLHVEAEQV